MDTSTRRTISAVTRADAAVTTALNRSVRAGEARSTKGKKLGELRASRRPTTDGLRHESRLATFLEADPNRDVAEACAAALVRRLSPVALRSSAHPGWHSITVGHRRPRHVSDPSVGDRRPDRLGRAPLAEQAPPPGRSREEQSRSAEERGSPSSPFIAMAWASVRPPLEERSMARRPLATSAARPVPHRAQSARGKRFEGHAGFAAKQLGATFRCLARQSPEAQHVRVRRRAESSASMPRHRMAHEVHGAAEREKAFARHLSRPEAPCRSKVGKAAGDVVRQSTSRCSPAWMPRKG